MSKYVVLTEEWIKEKLKISNENLEDIKTLIIQGNYEEKITYLGNALLHFSRLKILDLSRNCLKSIKGIDHIVSLEVLNLYYNCIEDINELRPLEHNSNLRDLDLRLNPVSRLNSDYRLYLTNLLPKLKTLDCRSIRDAERKAAIAYFDLDGQVSDFRSHSPVYRSGQTSKINKEPVAESNSHLCRNQSKLNTEVAMSHLYDPAYPDEQLRAKVPADEQDFYDINTKLNDPWTNHFLRANTKPNGNSKSLDPTRGVKQAEFYGKKERLQTEINLSSVVPKENGTKANGQEEKLCYANGKGLHAGVQTANRKPHDLTDGPRIPPRGKRYTPSSATITNDCGNADEKQIDIEHQPIRSQPYTSPQKMSNDLNRLGKFGQFDGNLDNSFLLVLKNFIEDAVSESFARYKSIEKKDMTVNKQNGQPNNTGSSVNRSDQLDALMYRSTITNEDFIKKRDSLQSKGSNIRDSYTLPDINGKSQDSDNISDEKNRKDLLNENLRLADEVERLKSRLKAYEELAITNPSATASSTTTLTTINNKSAFIPSSIQFYEDQTRRKMIESQTLVETTPLKRAISLMSSTPNIPQLTNSKRADYLEFEQALLFPSNMSHALKFHNSADTHSSSLARPKFII